MFTDVVMDDKPVLVNCFVYTPDIVVVMDETIIQKHVDVSKGITNETILVLNASSEAVAKEVSGGISVQDCLLCQCDPGGIGQYREGDSQWFHPGSAGQDRCGIH